MINWENWKRENDLKEILEKIAYDITDEIIGSAKKAFANDVLYYDNMPVNEDNLKGFLTYECTSEEYLLRLCGYDEAPFYFGYIMSKFIEQYNNVFYGNNDIITDDLSDLVFEYNTEEIIQNKIEQELSPEIVINILKTNPYLQNTFRDIHNRNEIQRKIRSEIGRIIPSNVSDLYSRKCKRHFILHVGSTNSGKTYHAIQALEQRKNGVYLAPLRLLAYEMYEKITADGISCSMTTGEESILHEKAKISSMTIEMLDLKNKYKIAIIDEAQMIGDKDRGAAWTNAILGINAETVHICMAPNAEQLIINLIELCGDSYEVHHYKRMTKLLPDLNQFHFPSSVQKGDALIVFSKKNVHACAAELQSKGYKCSIIYGNLPYEVRHNELKRFEIGETDVLVSTDAIGMGLNVPIKRIVFLETEKFDGTTRRDLNESEVKQIAGRAGRYGIYETGYYTAEYNRKKIIKKYEEYPHKINRAYIGFPEMLVSMPFNLSKILKEWKSSVPDDLFSIASLDAQTFLIERYERYCVDKDLLYTISRIPVKTDDIQMMNAMDKIVKKLCDGKDIKLDDFYVHQSIDYINKIYPLEQIYQYLDLMYNCISRFGNTDELSYIADEKKAVCNRITVLLKEKKLEAKKCRECGKKLPWNYPYNLCQSCYNSMHNFDTYRDLCY